MAKKHDNLPATKEEFALPSIVSMANGAMAATNAAAAAFMSEVKGPHVAPNVLPIATINHKGDAAGTFRLPSGQDVERLRGYIIYYFQNRSWWKDPFRPGKSAPPDCMSADMIKPLPMANLPQADNCFECDKAKFGSAVDGKAQACGVKTWLWFLNPEFGNPPVMALIAPASSIRAFLGSKFKAGYLGQSRAKNGAYELTYTEVSLLPGESETNYVCDPREIGACTDVAEARAIAEIRNQFLEAMKGMRGEVGVQMSEESPQVRTQDEQSAPTQA